jgi:hypothetical protein
MLTALVFRLLSLLGVLAGTTEEDVREEVTSPRVAQVRLAETLAEADAIQVLAKTGSITFAITRAGKPIEVVVTTRKGDVSALVIAPAAASKQLAGDISWLGDELASVTAIVRITTDADGAITLVTSDGRRYMVIPGRGSGGGNEAVDARWAGEWNTSD